VSSDVEHPIVFAAERKKPFRSGPIYNSVPFAGKPALCHGPHAPE
jgi:hypothetical protein